MKVLVIEDEFFAQKELERLINKNYPEFTVTAFLSSVEESIEYLKKNDVDLIFLDVHLSDGNCFDIFDKVKVDTPIIFTTAYDKYAIQAFDLNSIGYLLKPINENELTKSVDKLATINNHKVDYGILKEFLSNKTTYKERIMLKSGDEYISVNTKEIAYLYSEDKINFLVTNDNKSFITDYTLDYVEQVLDPKSFFRVSRSCIASINSIVKVSKYFNSRLSIVLTPEFKEQILVSRIKVPMFLKWLNDD